jgi:hypothetical protein
MIYLGIYIIGYILTLLFLVGFGKRLGLDYSRPRTYANQDDWKNNSEAYTAFSFGWPLLWLVVTIYLFTKGLVRFTKFLMRKTND